MQDERDRREFSTEGAVVEILERGGERFATIVLDPGTVLEVPAPSLDIHLGDRVRIDASLRVERVRARADLPPGAPLRDGFADDTRGAAPGIPGPSRFRDYEHVLRMAALFLVAIVMFLAWRSWMVPHDFGVYGHFRAGALTDAAARTPVYAGQASCVACHDDVQQLRLTGRHAAIACEACHGPLGQHARAETDVAPVRPSTRGVCLDCHTAKPGIPRAFPAVAVKEHAESGPCTDCHQAHAPGQS